MHPPPPPGITPPSGGGRVGEEGIDPSKGKGVDLSDGNGEPLRSVPTYPVGVPSDPLPFSLFPDGTVLPDDPRRPPWREGTEASRFDPVHSPPPTPSGSTDGSHPSEKETGFPFERNRLPSHQSTQKIDHRPQRCMEPHQRTRRIPSTRVATGLVVLVGAVAAFPFVVGKTAPKVDAGGPLQNSAIRRGVFHNSGSKDVGPTNHANHANERTKKNTERT